jgi:hypothetical protein
MNQQQLRRWDAVGIGVVVFLLDWSGFNKWEPDLFSRSHFGKSGGICLLRLL